MSDGHPQHLPVAVGPRYVERVLQVVEDPRRQPTVLLVKLPAPGGAEPVVAAYLQRLVAALQRRAARGPAALHVTVVEQDVAAEPEVAARECPVVHGERVLQLVPRLCVGGLWAPVDVLLLVDAPPPPLAAPRGGDRRGGPRPGEFWTGSTRVWNRSGADTDLVNTSAAVTL